MNPFTLGFLVRFRWVLIIQFLITCLAWTLQGKFSGARVHLEMLTGVAMTWDLMRGTVRAHLGLPLQRAAIARGLWYSVVAVSTAIHCAGMVAGATIGAAFGLPMSGGVLLLHAILSLVLAGTVQFLLTGLPTQVAVSLPQKIRDGFFGALWGLSIWGTTVVGIVAPQHWEQSGTATAVIVLFSFLTVCSWFTTQSMIQRRAGRMLVNAPEQRRAAAAAVYLPAWRVWQAWLDQEWRVQRSVSLLVILFGGMMALMRVLKLFPVTSTPHNGMSQLAMLCGMSMIPLTAALFGTLRVQRTLPLTLSQCAAAAVARPYLAVANLIITLMLVGLLTGAGIAFDARLAAFHFLLGSFLCLGQAFIVRWPSLPMVMLVSATAAPLNMLILTSPGLPVVPTSWLTLAAAALLPTAWLLHRRWLRTSTRIYRQNAWLTRLTAGVPR